jgi:aminoglycoside phosphotransferase family enzyme/predicted kinase
LRFVKISFVKKVHQDMTAAMKPNAGNQERVFAFLMRLSADPPVDRIDTHAASVFLAGSRALKVKRAVRFPFLDYSTLEKRKAACEAELDVNRPFAPQIYRRVVAITEAEDGSLSIDGDGAAIEYAVEMTRFDERQTLDHLVAAGPLDPTLVSGIADAIAASHARAAPAPTEPWIESIPALIAGNTLALRAAVPGHSQTIGELDEASRSAFSALRHLLAQRGEKGFVRHCHGDLHLGNIVVIDRKPVLFDAIEFDPAMASTDVFYDVAFPIMDLLRYRHGAAANVLLNRYLTMTSDENLTAMASLPLFMSMRAAVRAKVTYDRLARAKGDNAVAEAARAYLELAHQLVTPPPPRLVAIGGLSGTGKSVLARALAPALAPLPGAVVLRSDIARKQRFQARETDRLSAHAYEPEVTQKVYQDLERRCDQLLRAGHSVIVDAVFARPSERTPIRDLACARKVPFTGLFLVADVATRMSRVGERQGDASDATREIARLQEGYDVGAVDWKLIDASGTPEQTLRNVNSVLDGERQPGLR